MVAIREVSNLTSNDLDTLVRLYHDSFSQMVGFENQELSLKSIRRAMDPPWVHLAVAYEESTPAGFISYGIIEPRLLGFIANAWWYQNLTLSGRLSQTNRGILSSSFAHYLSTTSSCFFDEEHPPELGIFLEEPPISYFTSKDHLKFATAVRPEFRCKGIARQLTEFAENESRRLGAEHMFSVCSGEMATINQGMGYGPIISINPFYAGGQEGLLMAKRL